MTDLQKNFIKTVNPVIKTYAAKYGYNENVVVAITAQACNESAYGVSSLAKVFNYFGMKCGSYWKGKAVEKDTYEEYVEGSLTKIKDCFRAYDSMEEGIEGYFQFIAAKRYANLKTATTPNEYLTMIKEDGYATSSTYVSNIMAIVNQIIDMNVSEAKEKLKVSEVKVQQSKYSVGKNYVLHTAVNVRKGPGINYAKVGYINLTADGKKHDKDRNGSLDAGTVITCKEVATENGNTWIKCPSGWLAAEYNGEVYIRGEA